MNQNDEIEQIIQQAGLNKNESKIYAALLSGNEMNVTDIARVTGHKRTSVYAALSGLEHVGLVSKILRGKRNYFSATHPRRLLQLATFKQKQVEDNLGKLLGLYKKNGEKPRVQMFEGMKAVHDIYKECFERLKTGEEILIFTNIGKVQEKFPEIPEAFEKIIGSIVYSSQVRELVYGNHAGKDYARKLRSKIGSGYELRLSKESSTFGDNEQFIFKDKIIYFSLEKEIFVVVIENKDLATTHRTMFDMAWEQGYLPTT